MTADEQSLINPESSGKRRRKPKPFVPSLRSGSYALILGLSSLPQDSTAGLTKAQLIERAQEHCDSSFTAPADASKFYTAWNSMKTLLEKDLVYEKGRPLRRYYLSDEGWEVATRINNVKGDLHPSKNTAIPNLAISQELDDPGSEFDESEPEQYAAPQRPQFPRKGSPTYKIINQTDTLGHNGAGQKLGGAIADKFGLFSSSWETRALTENHKDSGRKFIEIFSSPEPQINQEVTTACPTTDLASETLESNSKSYITNDKPNHQPQVTSNLPKSSLNLDFQPIYIEPGAFTVHLVLDSREVRTKDDRDYIQDELVKKGIKPLVRPLELGDFFWVAKCKDPSLLARYGEEGDEIALDWIVERKRLDDLVGSIKDGRFHEQKFRLFKSGLKHVIYIIEEFTMSSERILSYHESIQTAIASTQVVNGYFVKKTQTLDDTIRYLARMTGILKSQYEVCNPSPRVKKPD